MITIKHKNIEQSCTESSLLSWRVKPEPVLIKNILKAPLRERIEKVFFLFFLYYSIVCWMIFYGSCVLRFLLTFKRIHFTKIGEISKTPYNIRFGYVLPWSWCWHTTLNAQRKNGMSHYIGQRLQQRTLHLTADGSIAILFLFHSLFSQIKVARKSCEAVKESKTILHLFISILLQRQQ